MITFTGIFSGLEMYIAVGATDRRLERGINRARWKGRAKSPDHLISESGRKRPLFFCLAGKRRKIRVEIGGVEGDRTPDLCNAIAALSQLSYDPDRNAKCRMQFAE